MTEFTPGSAKVHMDVRHDGPLIHVTFPSGRIDGTAVMQLHDSAAQLLSGPQSRLLVDLSGVNMVSSSGVGAMIMLKRRAMTEGAQFHLAIPADNARKVFTEMKLDKILEIFPTPETALASFKA